METNCSAKSDVRLVFYSLNACYYIQMRSKFTAEVGPVHNYCFGAHSTQRSKHQERKKFAIQIYIVFQEKEME